MLIAIRHKKGDPLAVTLVNIQPQLAETDDIYVMDTSFDREGWEIVKKFGSSRSLIFTEFGNYDFDTCMKFWKQRAIKNGHNGILFLDNVLLSTTFVSNLKRVIGSHGVIIPEVLESKDTLNPNFSWYGSPSEIRPFKYQGIQDNRCRYFHLTGFREVVSFTEKVALLDK
jgi:hypothetical protein